MLLIIRTINEFSAPKFLYILSGVITNLLLPERKQYLSHIITSNFSSHPIKALEIGSWFGEGSTKVILEKLPKNSDFFLIDSWKPYISKEDLTKKNIYQTVNNLNFSAIYNILKIIRLHEKKSSGGGVNNVSVNLIRGKSYDFLKIFKNNKFDFIYIDGSHYYHDVIKDINISKLLIKKDFGIICGDDLEKKPTARLIKFSKEHITEDYVQGFHPGVMLAVNEAVEKVNMKKGFWWVYCKNKKFTININ